MKLSPITLTAFSILALTSMISGCAIPKNGSRQRVDRGRQTLDETATTVWINKTRDYALMSELAYKGSAIDHPDSTNSWLRLTNRPVLLHALQTNGWVEITDRSDPTFANMDSKGLHFDVWQNTTHTPPTVAIAFRGTEFSDCKDWAANCRWFLPVIKSGDQYDQALEYVFPIVEKTVAKLGGDCRIVTTGHSLGGGLAQCIFYSSYAQPNPSLRVTRCFAFDPSPVTAALQYGNCKQRLDGRAARNALEKKMVGHLGTDQSSIICYDFGIARIFEQGEILAYPRTVLRQFWPLASFISELHFNFTREGGAITQHSMYALASSMLAYPKHETSPAPTGLETPRQRAAEVFEKKKIAENTEEIE